MIPSKWTASDYPVTHYQPIPSEVDEWLAEKFRCEHLDRWLTTYNAVLAGLYGSGFGGDVVEHHEAAEGAADLAHGPFKP